LASLLVIDKMRGPAEADARWWRRSHMTSNSPHSGSGGERGAPPQCGRRIRLVRALKYFLPPIVPGLYRRLTRSYEFSGDYRTWEEARAVCLGYDADVILERVKDAALKVVRGEAAFERDAAAFDEPQYWWPLLAALLWVASRNGNRLNLLDFGGSLGTTYRQNLRFLRHLEHLRWSIVEQPKFVECGRDLFEDERLRFYTSAEECVAHGEPDALLLSGVLQYLQDPYGVLDRVLRLGLTQIIVDRTPFLEGGADRLTVQNVPPALYPANYPAWFLGLDKFMDFMGRRYELVAEFDSFDTFQAAHMTALSKGFIFERR
jgi:putative methyltransferase (TIGR04325 family)